MGYNEDGSRSNTLYRKLDPRVLEQFKIEAQEYGMVNHKFAWPNNYLITDMVEAVINSYPNIAKYTATGVPKNVPKESMDQTSMSYILYAFFNLPFQDDRCRDIVETLIKADPNSKFNTFLRENGMRPDNDAPRWEVHTYLTPILEVICKVWILLRSNTRVKVHECSKGVINLVNCTDLHTFPSKPPSFFDTGSFIQVKDEQDFLFLDIYGIIVKKANDGAYRIMLLRRDGYAKYFRYDETWAYRDITEGDPLEDLFSIGIIFDEDREYATQAKRFLIIFSLLLEAEYTPLKEVSDRISKGERHVKNSLNKTGTWERVRLIVDAKKMRYKAGLGEKEPMSLEGKVQMNCPVRGFMRWQAYGERWSQHKWIYVAGFSTRRWVSPKPVRYSVEKK